MTAGASAAGWVAGTNDIARYEQGQEEFAADLLAKARIVAEGMGLQVAHDTGAENITADELMKLVENRAAFLVRDYVEEFGGLVRVVDR